MSEPLALPSVRSRVVSLRGSWTTAGAAALVAGTGFAHGGYFPEPWGWATLGAAWAAAGVLLARKDVALTLPAAAAAGLLAALTVWTGVSAAWSLDVTQTALEAQRAAVYTAALLAALLCARDRPERLVRGAWFAIVLVAGWALLTRLVPDRWGVVGEVSGYRLSEPVGYWNSLGLLAGMGALLALGLTARAETRLGRALAGASLPVLLTALYFTFSRGAWIALGAGVVALLALDRRRVQLAAVAAAVLPFAAVAVWRASTSEALTTRGSALPEMARQGHRELAVVAVAALAAGMAALALETLEPRLVLPGRAHAPARAALGAAVLVAFVGVTAAYGAPWTIARNAWHSFSSSPPASGANLNERLFSFSGTGRATQWRVALDQAGTEPLRGTGAGTYEVYWNRHRTAPGRIRDVHNLYVETLAELGAVGLVLLAGALAIPLAGAWRSRARPLTAAAFAAYTAYLVHAIVDWDWEIAAVTLAAVVCAAALLPEGRPIRARPAALALSVLLAAAAVYMIAMRIPITRLNAAIADGRRADAIHDVRDAATLAPWSDEPYLLLGEAELNAGLTGDAWGHFRTAVLKEPNNWIAWWDLARASVGVERTHALAEARRLNPLEPQLGQLPPRP